MQHPVIQNKFDTASARRIAASPFSDIAPDLEDILCWIQDGNWPVAKILLPYLRTISAHLDPHIVKILRGSDELWKYWALEIVAPDSVGRELRSELERLATNPTSGEAEEGLDGRAIELLGQRNAAPSRKPREVEDADDPRHPGA